MRRCGIARRRRCGIEKNEEMRNWDVKGWGVLKGVIVGYKWVVETVQYGGQKREVAGFVCNVVHRDQTVPDWSVRGGAPVQSFRCP